MCPSFFSLSLSLHSNCTLVWLGGQIGLTGCLWVVSRFRWWSLGGLGGDLEDGVGLVFWGVWGVVLRIMLVSLGRLGCGLECDLLGGHWDSPGSGVKGGLGLVCLCILIF